MTKLGIWVMALVFALGLFSDAMAQKEESSATGTPPAMEQPVVSGTGEKSPSLEKTETKNPNKVAKKKSKKKSKKKKTKKAKRKNVHTEG